MDKFGSVGLDSRSFFDARQNPQDAVSQPNIWTKCLNSLEGELSDQQFNTWIRPLQAVQGSGGLRLMAPNRFVMDWVRDRFLDRITELVAQFSDKEQLRVSIDVGDRRTVAPGQPQTKKAVGAVSRVANKAPVSLMRLNNDFTFNTLQAYTTEKV